MLKIFFSFKRNLLIDLCSRWHVDNENLVEKKRLRNSNEKRTVLSRSRNSFTLLLTRPPSDVAEAKFFVAEQAVRRSCKKLLVCRVPEHGGAQGAYRSGRDDVQSEQRQSVDSRGRLGPVHGAGAGHGHGCRQDTDHGDDQGADGYGSAWCSQRQRTRWLWWRHKGRNSSIRGTTKGRQVRWETGEKCRVSKWRQDAKTNVQTTTCWLVSR